VLEIGCNAGFYALEMKHCGADLVAAIDSDPRNLAQARLAAEVRQLRIEFKQMSVYDVSSLGRRFDLVLFMGVLCHLRHPLLASNLIAEGNQTRQLVLDLGMIPVVPPKSNRLHPWDYDRALYKKRNEIERLFRRLKGFRRIFSRFEKLDVVFLSFLSFPLIVEALRLV
jgi:SAM-dependent methyltransferase